jgi:anti-anti-sigma regulatory factor
VVFSLFGKKSAPPPKKPEIKKAGQQSAAQTAPGSAPAGRGKPPPPAPPADEGADLDFSSFVPAAPRATEPPPEPYREPAKPAPEPAAAPPAVKPAPPAAAPPAPVAAPPVAKAAPPAAVPPAAKPAPAPVAPHARPLDSIMSIEVTSSNDATPVIEEAAILFANAQDHGALAALLKAVLEDELGPSGLQVWLMLFDMYQHLGMKKDFEELALDFAAKFERSPPVWAGPEQNAEDAAQRTGGAAYVSLGDALTAKCAPLVEIIKAGIGKKEMLRLDFAKLQSVDAEGCRLLLDALQQFKRAGKELIFSGEAQLIKLLAQVAKLEDKSVDQAIWLLLIEIYQMLGLQDQFEEAALNYAITFEVSPPSWETKKKLGAKPAQAAASAAEGGAVLRLSGEITGTREDALKAIIEYAGKNNPALIDFTAVRRIDFVSAGQLLNALGKLRGAGKTVQIQGASEMIVALFSAMGIDAVATIVHHK